MVVDTNVFVYALLRIEGLHQEAGDAIEAAERIVVPDSIWADMASSVWQWICAGHHSLAEGVDALERGAAFVTDEVETKALWERALQLAVSADHPAYDAIFAALAEREGTRVVTYDRRFRIAFPELSISPAEFLAG